VRRRKVTRRRRRLRKCRVQVYVKASRMACTVHTCSVLPGAASIQWPSIAAVAAASTTVLQLEECMWTWAASNKALLYLMFHFIWSSLVSPHIL
jgi:hypothetical protein